VILSIIGWAINVAIILLFCYGLLSFVAPYYEQVRPAYRFLDRLFAPLLSPIRRVLPPVGVGGMGIDFSPMILFLVLVVLRAFL
jgi:YggT family protein